MNPLHVLFIFLALSQLVVVQDTRRGAKKDEEPNESAVERPIDYIGDILFPGSKDTPIMTRIFNKLNYYIAGIIAAVVGYFSYFRNKKKRYQKINDFLAQRQQKMALNTDPIDTDSAQKLIYDLNFAKNLKIEMKSNNGRMFQNLNLSTFEAEHDSPRIYHLKLEGTDPDGRSVLQGYGSFLAGTRLQVVLAQTHDKYEKKGYVPVHYFEGEQTDQTKVVEGEWWIEGQKDTQGDYAGKWRLSF